MRFPRFPAPRLYLGPWAWLFVMTALAVVYVCTVTLWAMGALMYWFYAGVVRLARWGFLKLTGRTL